MARTSDETLQGRKERAWLYVRRHASGCTEGEIAEFTGFERRTVNNYLRELESEGKLFKDGTLWHALDFEQTRLRSFDLQPEEAMALYLGARLLVKQQDKRNEPAETALLKLAQILAADAGVGKEIEEAAHELAGRPVLAGYQPVFQAVVRGYLYRRKVALRYRPLNGRPFETLFSTYLIEPSQVGYATYLIGHSDISGGLRSYKLERVEEARLTAEGYRIPADFKGLEILRNAWSIIYGEKTLRVALRFSPRVRERVLETTWHPSQQTAEDGERAGWLRWEAEVADTTDMLPWIRGWGADVEVLGPEGLRKQLVEEIKKMEELYKRNEFAKEQAPRPVFYAHSKEGEEKNSWQRLIDHLEKSSNLAEEFGRDAGVAQLAKIAALVHDLGKYSLEFQQRLEGKKIRVDHSTAGAKELHQVFMGTNQETLADLLAYCIIGHHAGLPDYGDTSDMPGDGTLQARFKTEICNYNAYKTELDLTKLEFPKWLNIHPLRLRLNSDRPPKDHQGFSVAFLTRMVYSALVDADFQETETFIQGKRARGGYESIGTLCDKLNDHLHKFDNPETDINRKRTETLKACIEKAVDPPGFFKLTIPTGGGKTLASMAFALNHAAAHDLKRIIYVIPFTTIIEQNAGVFKEILGDDNILEHHSNFDWDHNKRAASETADDQTKSVYTKLKLAAENWDIPVVVTTNVQFFESLFANKSSRCRKLHNIAKSVIIFDEAQMFPKDYMLPAMGAVWELVTNYGASAVFCTATQPNLEKFLPEKIKVTELAPNPQELFEFYKRVEVKHIEGKLSDNDLIERLHAQKQVLCIVNTRKHASGLFQKLEGEGNFHLSTLMCPIHRRQKLMEIRRRLENDQVCRVISTSVMEAGVDVDFPLGYRALTGLDSINQAAGRVNRNMKQALSEVVIFEPESEFIRRTPRYVAQGVEVTRSVLRDHNDAPISIPAIEAYFERLYALKEPHDFDYQDILGSFQISQKNQPIFKFATVAENFHIIEDVTQTVIIPFDEEARKLIEELKFAQYPSSTLRKLQPYTVSIYQGEFEALNSKGVIEAVADSYAALSDVKNYYDPMRGLMVPAGEGGDGLFF